MQQGYLIDFEKHTLKYFHLLFFLFNLVQMGFFILRACFTCLELVNTEIFIKNLRLAAPMRYQYTLATSCKWHL